MQIKKYLTQFLILCGLVLSTCVSAGSVTKGAFVLNFDEASLFNLDVQVKNVNWFDSAASAEKTPQEMRDTAPSESVPDSFTFAVFGSSIPTPPLGLEERAPQPSTFQYEGDPTTGIGRIGLAGFHIISTLAGGVSMGDYALSYDASRIGNNAGGSGWFITNYHAFRLESFDLTNVEVTLIDEENFSLSGDVVIASELALLLSAEEGTDVGDFTFTTVADSDPSLDASIASYSFATQILTLPMIMSDGGHYTGTFTVSILQDKRVALDLTSIAISASMTETHAMFDINTGVLSMPEVVLLDIGEASGDKIEATMKLEAGYFPARFILLNTSPIAE
ncbi:hypothetical protein AU255_08660 [Methyloprofundus sedimenti]|uniref:Uncharacterized protein n=1 Tax=Methyloprofundus sedimenti TaxID=1420851 RepID=A0A1V8M8T7_9GAMM|nr:hypothetical protein [Methyloprofundus sedimenti]OQK17916.1 hypothetical protein AU255_08660 [Methyloprofundus sedimenti]